MRTIAQTHRRTNIVCLLVNEAREDKWSSEEAEIGQPGKFERQRESRRTPVSDLANKAFDVKVENPTEERTISDRRTPSASQPLRAPWFRAGPQAEGVVIRYRSESVTLPCHFYQCLHDRSMSYLVVTIG